MRRALLLVGWLQIGACVVAVVVHYLIGRLPDIAMMEGRISLLIAMCMIGLAELLKKQGGNR